MTERYNSVLTTMRKLIGVLILLLITGSTVHSKQLTAMNTLKGNQNDYVTIKFNDERLANALLKLTRQVKVGISYSTHTIPDKKITYQAEDKLVHQVLNDMLEGTRLYVTLSNNRKTIVIKEKALQPFKREEIVTGTVTDANTRETLPGVSIAIKGTTKGTATDGDGRFSLTVENLQETLIFSFIGYQRQEVPLQGREEIDVALSPTMVGLDEVVVTGVAGGTQRRALGNELATVDAIKTMEVAPISDVQDLLGSRISGVDVSGGSGVLGGGASIRIRGNASISLSNNPLIYIDGVRIDNNPNAGPGGNFNMRQGRTVSRMNDLNPEDIKSMEVIKGPAAATLYGTEAANGVIQIITKRGNSGKPRLNVMLRSGMNTFLNAKDRLPRGYRRAGDGTGDLLEWNIYEQEDAKGDLNKTFLQKGLVKSFSANLGGGSEGIRYYLSGKFDDSEGFIPWNTRSTSNIRANINVAPSESFTVTGDIGYSTGDTRLAQVSSPYGIWDSAVWGHTDRKANLGFYTTPPGESPKGITAKTSLNRVTWSVNVTNIPNKWLEHRLVIGQDFSTETNTQLFKRVPPSSRQFFGGASKGQKQREDVETLYKSFDYSATGNFDFSSNLTITPSIGVQYYSKEITRLYALGREFPSRNIESIGGAAVTTASESFLPNKTLGGYVQGLFGWKNKLFLTLAVRGDDNSAFGVNYEAVVYPKASIAWVLSDEDFFRLPGVSSLRIRSAYGQSGQQPDIFAASRLYNPATGPGNVPVITPDNIGNPDLGPEKGKEIEIGFDAQLFDNVNVGFSYYNQTTSDAILARQLPLSAGFPGTQFVNIGKVSNKGVELEIDGDVIRKPNLNWNLGGTFSWNKNELVDLGGVPETENLYTSLKEGYPLWGYWGVEIVDAKLDGNGDVIMASIMCNQTDGSVKPCINSAPRIYKGPQTPKFQGSVNTNISFLKNWVFFANIDYKFGNYRGDGDVGFAHMLMSDTKAIVGSPIGTGVSETENIPGVGDLIYNRYTQSTGPDPIAKAYAKSPTGWGNNLFIHNAGFVRLRELSLRYNLPKVWGKNLGVNNASLTASGRNLWFLYRVQKSILGRGIVDPEVSRAQGFLSQTQTTLPLITSFLLTFRIDV